MENWAVEHERRKEEGYFPKGIESVLIYFFSFLKGQDVQEIIIPLLS